jgi:NAD-dependent dihydropyrimidine dehydrogenase PreA subunit
VLQQFGVVIVVDVERCVGPVCSEIVGVPSKTSWSVIVAAEYETVEADSTEGLNSGISTEDKCSFCATNHRVS